MFKHDFPKKMERNTILSARNFRPIWKTENGYSWVVWKRGMLAKAATTITITAPLQA